MNDMSSASNNATSRPQPVVDHVSYELESLRGDINSMNKSDRKVRLLNSCDDLERKLQGYQHDDLIAAELELIVGNLDSGLRAIADQLYDIKTALDSISQTENGQKTSAILSHIDETLTGSMNRLVGP